MLATSWLGHVLGSEALFFSSAMVAVYGMPVRPYGRCQRPLRWPIRAAMTSPCTSQQALAFGEFPTWDDVRCFPGIRAARFPVTSLTHRACAVSHAGQHARIVPETRSADRTRGMQHVMPRTRAHISAVHAASSYPTWNVSGPDREDAHVPAVRGAPRTPSEPSREPSAVTKSTLHGAEGSPHPSPV